MSEPNAEYDSPWKEALEEEFREFLAFFFPEVHAGIDWSHPVEFLDKELQQITPDSAIGPRVVDKLAKVRRQDRSEAWVLAHVEVQGQEQESFEERMYTYNYRAFDCKHLPVVSLAVLGDSNPKWRPDRYERSLWGCNVKLEFPVVKLLDYAALWEMLEASDNPYAVVVMAHLRTLSTHGDPQSRREWKIRLVRALYSHGWSRERVRRVFRLIDWMMSLPPELERDFHYEVMRLEEETRMRYVTSIERIAKEIGREEGREEGSVETAQAVLLDVLGLRFESVPEAVVAAIRSTTDPRRLLELHRKAITSQSLEEFVRYQAQ